jgi:hypothetical protein
MCHRSWEQINRDGSTYLPWRSACDHRRDHIADLDRRVGASEQRAGSRPLSAEASHEPAQGGTR